jgi:hypothetical protein
MSHLLGPLEPNIQRRTFKPSAQFKPNTLYHVDVVNEHNVGVQLGLDALGDHEVADPGSQVGINRTGEVDVLCHISISELGY